MKRSLHVFLFSMITWQASQATPTCPIITNQFQGSNGTAIDNTATGWSVDSSNLHAPHPANYYFAINSNRFTATNLGGIGIINSKVFNISGYRSPQVSVKITSEGIRAVDSVNDYIEFYYKLDGGPLVLVAHQNGVVGSLTFTSPVLHGTTVQLVIKLKNVNNGTGTKSNYYVERYDVFQTAGPCTPGTASLNVTTSATNGGLIGCTNTSTQLSGTFTPASTTNVTYWWSGPSFSNSTTSTSPTVSNPGVDTLFVTVGTGGTSTLWGMATIAVTKNVTPPANVTASNSNALTCIDGSTTLTGASTTAGSTFAWTGPNSFSASGVSVTTSTAGGYSVRATNPANGCTASASTTVAQNIAQPANIAASVDSVLTCKTNAVHLTASTTATNITYAWTTPDGTTTTPSATSALTVSTPGQYTVTVKDITNGCAASAAAVVDQNITVPADVTTTPPSGQITCAHPNVTLTGSSSTAGVSFNWTGPNFNATGATATITTSGIYTVTATDPTNGCAAFATGTVTRNTNAPIGVTAGTSDVISCFTPSVFVTGSTTTAGATFSWIGPDGFTSSDANAEASEPGTYTLTVTNPVNGCTTTATAVVEDNTTPPADVAATNNGPINCINTSATITGTTSTQDVIYTWIAPDQSLIQGATNTVIVPGTYTLVVTDQGNGCASIATTTVDKNTVGCLGGSFQTNPGGNSRSAASLASNGNTLSAFTYKAYPNPFTTQAAVEFTSPVNAPVVVELYSTAGVREKVLFEGDAMANQSCKLALGKAGLLPGAHFCIIRSNGKAFITTLILVK